jgi:hypothetical protein
MEVKHYQGQGDRRLTEILNVCLSYPQGLGLRQTKCIPSYGNNLIGV